jgi:sarcosine oxidase subunit delta
MKLLTCPINGPRPVSEFVYGGPVRTMPDPAACSDADWSAYVFERDGVAGLKREWWYHAASGVWFIAERDTARDHVLRTYLWGQQGSGGGA